jgi:hypothetical protein
MNWGISLDIFIKSLVTIIKSLPNMAVPRKLILDTRNP